MPLEDYQTGTSENGKEYSFELETLDKIQFTFQKKSKIINLKEINAKQYLHPTQLYLIYTGRYCLEAFYSIFIMHTAVYQVLNWFQNPQSSHV